MATSKEITNLVINKVESQEVYDYMAENNLINDDELYLVKEDDESESVIPSVSAADNGKFLRVVDSAPAWAEADGGTFIAEYGVTTADEIRQAYQSGKSVFARYSQYGMDFVAPLQFCTQGMAYFTFANMSNSYQPALLAVSGSEWQIETAVTHASTHEIGGSDPITPEMIGAASTTYVDEKVADAVANVGSAIVYEATIGTNWTEDGETGVKTQTVTISGVTASNTAKVDHSSASVDGTSEGYATFIEEENQYLTYITNGYAETVADGIKFTIFGDINTVEIPIVVEVV